jgi:hypothetical protein
MQPTVELTSYLFSKPMGFNLQKSQRHRIFLCLLFFTLTGCVNKQPPREEFNLARAALNAAKLSEAKRYAPKVYSQAKRYMRKAERAYEERYFDKSTDLFRKSRYYSEKAENISRVKMFDKGGMAP